MPFIYADEDLNPGACNSNIPEFNSHSHRLSLALLIFAHQEKIREYEFNADYGHMKTNRWPPECPLSAVLFQSSRRVLNKKGFKVH